MLAILEQGTKQYAMLRMSLNNDNSISVEGKSTVNSKILSEEALDHYCNLRLFELLYNIRVKCKGKDRESYASIETDKRIQSTLENMIDVLRISK